MALRIYNTLTQAKEEFRPRHGHRVDMFVCGITPQDSTHMGHARTYTTFDVVAKYLRSQGYRVFYLQNVTDVEDRIINKAKERGTTEAAIAEQYFEEFLGVMEALGIDSVNLYARATDYIPEIIEQIRGLMDKGYAYASPDGSVYYDVSKFHDFGRLSRVKPEALQAGARVAVDERKRDPQDFVLWKAEKPGEPAWPSPWGPGRPGWHIEDTAITVYHFGPQYDLHGGGIDLVFPHHEAEIAQAEAFTGKKPLVRYWMHAGHVNIEGAKMSKSLRNFVTAREALTRFPPQVLRFFFINMHYRSPLDYTEEAMEEARRAVGRLWEMVDNLRRAQGAAAGAGDGVLHRATEALGKAYGEAMDDDFNTREAIAALFTFTTEANQALRAGVGGDAAAKAVGLMETMDGVLGVLNPPASGAGEAAPLLKLLGGARDRARGEKAYGVSDWIRDELQRLGYTVEDTQAGTQIRRRG